MIFTPKNIVDISSSGLFDVDWYCNQYPDVKGTGLSPIEHYLYIGSDIFRNPSTLFNTRYYTECNPGVVAHKMNPLLHFIYHGRKESRRPIPPGEWRARQPSFAYLNGAFVEILRYPSRKKADGRHLASISRNNGHFWYRNEAVDRVACASDQDLKIPNVSRILIIGHDFILSTGVTRPISHYLNAMANRGGLEITSVELAPGAKSASIKNDVYVSDFIIVNSLSPLRTHDDLIELLIEVGPMRCAIYLHETSWSFDRFAREQPERFATFMESIPRLNFFCVSDAQADWLKTIYKATNVHVVYNTTQIFEKEPTFPKITPLIRDTKIRVGMLGTIQPRKGVELFSKCADRAKDLGLPYDFYWAGWDAGGDAYRSDNVRFVGSLDGASLAEFMANIDIVFIPSLDDPFPLVCIEAIILYKRMVVSKYTGFASEIDKLKGCLILENYQEDAALEAIDLVSRVKIDSVGYDALIEKFSLLEFVVRINTAISISILAASPPTITQKKSLKIGIIIHLFYIDLWPEIRSYIANVAHFKPDLYISLNEEQENSTIEHIIRQTHPDATIFKLPNRGMDIGPFVHIVNYLNTNCSDYDLILKLHSKKSLAASGLEAGQIWRRGLFDGLVGSKSIVDSTIGNFLRNPDLGMLGPKGMRIGKSSRDISANTHKNEASMISLGAKLGIANVELDFFRGSMFWCRAKFIKDRIGSANLSIADFEPSHQIDESKAHAFERLFGCLVKASGLRLAEFDDSLPQSLNSFRDIHSGQDIYVLLSGSSTGFFNESFFYGKTTIGVNRILSYLPCSYIVVKEFPGSKYLRLLNDSCTNVFVSKFDTGNIKRGKERLNRDFFRGDNYYFYEHKENYLDTIDLSVINRDSNMLVVSSSTVTTAMHLAAFMGAKNIILVGHDCGLLDGKASIEGYNFDIKLTPWKSEGDYLLWLKAIEAQTIQVRNAICEHFGCNIYSLNPFINFGLEDHTYSRLTST